MENHQSIWQLILESNLINFIIFSGILFWLIKAKLPSLVKDKNIELATELKKAEENYNFAKDQLKNAQQELNSLKIDFDKMRADTKKKAEILKQKLEQEKEDSLNALKIRHKREVENIKNLAKKEMQTILSLKALEITENSLKNNSNNYDNFNQKALEDTLNFLKKS
jgi:F0F1-type ATP synthase membrane subunit b/b'